MTNVSSVLVYIPLILMTLVFFVSLVFQKNKPRVTFLTMILAALLICWSLCELSYYLIKNIRWLNYITSLKQIFVAFIPVVIMFIVFGYFRLNTKIPKWFPLVICIVPSITSVFCLTSPFHNLITQSFTIISYVPLLRFERTYGIWNYVHVIYSQVLVFVMALIIILKQRRLPRVYRKAPTFITIALGIYIFAALIETVYLYRINLDFQLIALHLSIPLFYLASITNHRTDYLNIDRSNIFNYLDDAIFILDSSGKIVDGNMAAFRFMDLLDEPFQYIPLYKLLEQCVENKKIIKRNLDKYEGKDVYIINGRFTVIYNLQEYPFRDKNNETVGFYAILKDVTQNRLLLERMREISGRDQLTGLPNRYHYQKLLKKLDTSDSLPLSIVICRLNDLRSFNEANGRNMGDFLLKRVAEILGKCRSEAGYAARIGGAEFIILIPRYNEPRAKDIVNDVKVNYYELRHREIQAAPPLLLGVATKYNLEENINELIEDADFNMINDNQFRESLKA